MNVNPVVAAGFGRAADAYERSRPGYPAEAVARLVAELGIGPGQTVLDLAAGTGKLTRLLVEFGADLVAVEPSAAMRSEFASVLPDIPVHEGTAEQIPLADDSVDAVVVAQAFHWFNAPRGPGGDRARAAAARWARSRSGTNATSRCPGSPS